MQYWLFKSEPTEYSWEQMEKDQITPWDGVRNHQAQNFMKSMRMGDFGFFYHSAIKDKAIVGIVEICKEHYRIVGEDPRFGMVDVKFLKTLPKQVLLRDMKENQVLKNMLMIRQSRLSISPVSENEWHEIVRMSESTKK